MVMKYAFLVIFVFIMVAIGIFSKRKVKNVQDFFLGGRQMGPWLTAFAYGTTYFSAVIFIGYAGKIGWGFGISSTFIGIGNAIIGSLLAWLVLAKRTRKMTHELNVSTMPEFFEKRYGSRASFSLSRAGILVRENLRHTLCLLHGRHGAAYRRISAAGRLCGHSPE